MKDERRPPPPSTHEKHEQERKNVNPLSGNETDVTHRHTQCYRIRRRENDRYPE